MCVAGEGRRCNREVAYTIQCAVILVHLPISNIAFELSYCFPCAARLEKIRLLSLNITTDPLSFRDFPLSAQLFSDSVFMSKAMTKAYYTRRANRHGGVARCY
jgi:hypothetical protein